MDNKRADIQQIQKYLNGELDAKAMHRLEREAQDDPFLMDALEGYGRTKSDQQDVLASLQERLQARTATKTKRLMPWAVISIAASVIGFTVVVGLLYKGNKPEPVAKVAMNQPAKNKTAEKAAVVTDKKVIQAILDTPLTQMAYNQPKPKYERSYARGVHSNQYNAPVVVSEINSAPADELKKLPDSPAMEDRIMGYIAAKRQDTVLGGGTVATTNNAAALTILNSKTIGAGITVRPGRPSDNSAYALSQAGLSANLISGVVLDRTNGLPLPGATVKVVGRSTGTQTDANGKFTLPNVKKDETLSIGIIGYDSKTLDVKGKDSLKVEMEGSSSSLSEVVVVPAADKKRKAAKARPQIGWDAFKKHLEENAVGINEKEGIVELAFTVNANGAITNINVTKSLNAATDAKAISLIKDGPVWSGNTNSKPEVVKVRVEFHK